MNKETIEVTLPILYEVDAMEVVKTFTEEQLWYVCAIAYALEKEEKQNIDLQQKIEKAISKCKERISYCKEQQSDYEWECCIEELELVCKILEDGNNG